MPTITIDESRLGHIFREAQGHFREDNAVNRQTLIDVANRPANLLGTDHFGNAWFAETRADGTQIWAQVRDGKITNGGLNLTPRIFPLSPSRAVSRSDPIQ
jgi:filamentous hemagglutinin